MSKLQLTRKQTISVLIGGMAAIVSGPASAQGELVVYCTIATREVVQELTPAFERATKQKVSLTVDGGPALFQRIADGAKGDLFVGPEEFSGPLIQQGKLARNATTAFARSTISLAVREGAAVPDITTPEKLKAALLSAKTVSYSAGVSGLQFVRIMEQLGIAGQVAGKLVSPEPGELVGAVVARGGADIGVQQLSEMLPVSGIRIVGSLPAELRQPIIYGSTLFLDAKQPVAAKAFADFLRSPRARELLRKKGLEPA